MNIRFCSLLLLLLTGLLNTACEKKKPAQHTEQPTPIATLAKTAYNLGDTILVRLSQSVTRPEVTVDAEASPIFQQTGKALAIGYTGGKTGLHQLIVI